jgi:hypothetical protein
MFNQDPILKLAAEDIWWWPLVESFIDTLRQHLCKSVQIAMISQPTNN